MDAVGEVALKDCRRAFAGMACVVIHGRVFEASSMVVGTILLPTLPANAGGSKKVQAIARSLWNLVSEIGSGCDSLLKTVNLDQDAFSKKRLLVKSSTLSQQSMSLKLAIASDLFRGFDQALRMFKDMHRSSGRKGS